MGLPLLNNLRHKLITSIRTVFIEEMQKRGEISSEDAVRFNYSGISFSEPRNKSFGDLTTNAAMVLAPVLRKNPAEVAAMIIEKIIGRWEEPENASVAVPGFINFSFNRCFIEKQMQVLAGLNEEYGLNDSKKGIKIQIEFVSANPTGNLHIGHGRWAALGDSLSNIYEANGYDVCREYYVNDYGSQINKFGQCLASTYLKAFNTAVPYPDDGYPEEVVGSLADEIIKNDGGRYLIMPAATGDGSSSGSNSPAADRESLGRKGIKIMLGRIASTLDSMGVEFDRWFYESSLYEDSNFNRTVSELKK
ncbi:MAG: arginine--tRNA ligase, partial [Actinobacteria bacterium]|nr:arginine--tRNA ligase [Actinomycetota bacterium]